MSEPVVRPDLMKPEYLVFLDNLRESATVNMYEATPLLAEEFDLEKSFARQVLIYWMKTFSDRHPE